MEEKSKCNVPREKVLRTNVLFEEYIIDWKIEKNLLTDTPVPEGNVVCHGPNFDSLDFLFSRKTIMLLSQKSNPKS